MKQIKEALGIIIATFNNISSILVPWRSYLLMQEATEREECPETCRKAMNSVPISTKNGDVDSPYGVGMNSTRLYVITCISALLQPPNVTEAVVVVIVW